MKMPRVIKAYCSKCKKHTDHEAKKVVKRPTEKVYLKTIVVKKEENA